MTKEEREAAFMTDKKGWGATVAGWFIERDDDHAHASLVESDASVDVSDITEQSAASLSGEADYATPSPTQGVFHTPPPAAIGGRADL